MPFTDDYDGSIVAVLGQLRQTAEVEGVAVLDLSPDAADAPVAYLLGTEVPGLTDLGRSLLLHTADRPSQAVTVDKRPVLACPWMLPPARLGGLLLWRAPRSRAWKDSDHPLAASVALLLRGLIGAGMGQVGIDRLTGLPNRRWFLDEADRRIDRLDIDGSVVTLILVDIDNLRAINLALGREQGDGVLVRMASHLRAMVRPTDLVARIGADEFALWLDGMDHLTAAERADALCSRGLFKDVPAPRPVTFSVGIASRKPESAEDVRTMLRRAHMAARDIKSGGGGGWRVDHPASMSRSSGPPR